MTRTEVSQSIFKYIVTVNIGQEEFEILHNDNDFFNTVNFTVNIFFQKEGACRCR